MLRREKVEGLLYRGKTIRQMAKDLQVHVKTIDNDLKFVRSKAGNWYRENQTREQRTHNNLYVRVGAIYELIREAWNNYGKTDGEIKVRWHQQVLRANKMLTDLEGLTGVSNIHMEMERDLEELRETLADIKRIEAGSKAVTSSGISA